MSIDFEKEIEFYLENKSNNTIIAQMIDNSERNKLLDEIDRKENEIEKLKLDIRIQKDREKNIINALISVLDSIQWFSKIAGPLGNDAIATTINKTKKKIKNSIITIGLLEINEENDVFNCSLHNCIDIKEDETKDSNLIDEVIRSGYIYKGEVIRAADVIVIKNE